MVTTAVVETSKGSVASSHGSGTSAKLALEEGLEGVAPRAPSQAELVELHHRHGNLFTATSHIITAIIGAGVLGLSYSLAWMGWPAGIACICGFYAVTLLTSMLLAKTYEVGGHKHRRYTDAVRDILGHRAEVALFVLQHANLVLVGIAYTIAAGKSAEAVMRTATDTVESESNIWQEVLVFGGIQLFFSQLPDLDAAWWSSVIGAAMSIGYSAVALGLCSAKASNGHGTIGGIPGTSTSDKVFHVFQALGNFAFAYNFSTVLLEIQDTLREPPKAEKTMGRAIHISVATTFVFYLSIAVTGYLALGDNTFYMVDDILTSPNIGPAWVIIFANCMVFVHMISAYQVFSQPVFVTCEGALCKWFPNSVGAMNKRVLSLLLRSIYVGFTTLVSCVLPFFASIVGLIGAMVFWPCAVLFPILMYTKVRQVSRRMWYLLHSINVVMFVISAVAVVGSLQSIVVSASGYTFF